MKTYRIQADILNHFLYGQPLPEQPEDVSDSRWKAWINWGRVESEKIKRKDEEIDASNQDDNENA